MDYRKLLLAVCPHGKQDVIDGFAAALPQAANDAELFSRRRLGLFIGECAEESDHFKTTVEYASGGEYEGRKDLGNVKKGDGKRFKGRGVIQLTGRSNYRACGKALGTDLEGHPERAAMWPYAALSAAWFWKQNNLNSLADIKDPDEAIKRVTKRINGGYNGLAERTRMVKIAWNALDDLKGTLHTVAKQEKKAAQTKAAAATAGTASSVSIAQTAITPPAVVTPPSAPQLPTMPPAVHDVGTAVHLALGQHSVWILIAISFVLIVSAIMLVRSVAKHSAAARRLTTAANEV